jgi:hypothetical protein
MALRFIKFSSVTVTVTVHIGIICIYICVYVVEVLVNCVAGAPTYKLSVVSGTDIARNIYLVVGV